METEAPARSLVNLELALEIAVDQLTAEGRELVERTAEGARSARVPSLLDQLDDARTSRSGPGVGAPARTKAVVRVEVLDALEAVEAVVGRHSRPTLAGRVRAWSAEQHSATDPEVLSAAVELAEAWVDRARSLLNPRPAWRVRGIACPACGERVEHRTNSLGEEVLAAALECRPDEGLICVVCRATWDLDVLKAMAEHIERQTATETLALDER